MSKPTVQPPRTREQVSDYLRSFDLFKGNEWEGGVYVDEGLGRFMITTQMLPPAPRPGARLLELGANPYFITLLLKRFHRYELVLANYFGSDTMPRSGEQVVRSERYDECHTFAYDYFNSELEQFPYPDDSFDVVLFCEILEHLTLDPTHVLNEIHRVLRPGGLILLTTPNMLRWEHLRDLALGKNINDPYSGYGVYGRHNREYAPQEVIRLLEECGFSVRQVRLANVHPGRTVARLMSGIRHHWAEHSFFLAAADRQRRYRYSPWLYRSMVGPRHALRSRVVMGENDEAHTGTGWHLPEGRYTDIRWTQRQATIFLRAEGGERLVTVELSPGPMQLGPVTVSLECMGVQQAYPLARDEWSMLRLPLDPCAPDATLTLTITVDHLHNPRALGFNEDPRDLGVLVRRLGLEYGPAN
jgi:SAM-dependent methyltransferase